MSVWGALAGGFVGTLVLTTGLRAASELRLTRTDLPFLLGTVLHRRPRARQGARLSAPLRSPGRSSRSIYYAVFVAIDESGWLLGGALRPPPRRLRGHRAGQHPAPLVHPRMGTADSAADARPLLEPPGFLMLNYGREHPGGHARRPRRLRRDRRRLRLAFGRRLRRAQLTGGGVPSALAGSGPIGTEHAWRTRSAQTSSAAGGVGARAEVVPVDQILAGVVRAIAGDSGRRDPGRAGWA